MPKHEVYSAGKSGWRRLQQHLAICQHNGASKCLGEGVRARSSCQPATRAESFTTLSLKSGVLLFVKGRGMTWQLQNGTHPGSPLVASCLHCPGLECSACAAWCAPRAQCSAGRVASAAHNTSEILVNTLLNRKSWDAHNTLGQQHFGHGRGPGAR